MYEAIVTLHILSGMAWVGGVLVFLLGWHTIRAEKGDAEAIAVGDRLERATKLITATPFLVLGTGITQVLMSEQHDWSHLWIMLAITLFVVIVVVGGANDATFKKAQRRAGEPGKVPAKAFDLSIKLLWVEFGVMVAIVTLMVFKPV